jgi:phosphomethylpyrimidine synthase
MKITQDVREYAEKQGITADAALEQGMQQKSIEFVKRGAQIYHRS